MSDELEKMPGGWFIELGEIRKYRAFQDFKVMDSEGLYHIVEYNKEILSSFNYYAEIWDNCNHYGLPERDWTMNPPWLVSFVKMFDRLYYQIEAYRNERRRRYGSNN